MTLDSGPPTLLEPLDDPPRKLLEQPARKTREFRLLGVPREAEVVLAVVECLAPEPARLLEILGHVVVVGVDGVVPDEDPQGEEGGRVEVFPLAVRPPAGTDCLAGAKQTGRELVEGLIDLQCAKVREVAVLELLASFWVRYDAVLR